MRKTKQMQAEINAIREMPLGLLTLYVGPERDVRKIPTMMDPDPHNFLLLSPECEACRKIKEGVSVAIKLRRAKAQAALLAILDIEQGRLEVWDGPPRSPTIIKNDFPRPGWDIRECQLCKTCLELHKHVEKLLKLLEK